MIALVDVGRRTARFALLRQEGTQWFLVDEKNAFPALQEALNNWSGRLTHVAALRYADDVDPAIKPTWSGVRQTTTLVNSLAFAWGVPAVDVHAGGASDQAIIEAAVAACHAVGVPSAPQLVSEYDGQPNITQPKEKE